MIYAMQYKSNQIETVITAQTRNAWSSTQIYRYALGPYTR